MPDHPSEADLRAYGLGRLDDAPAAEIAAHLDACPACRRRAAEASSDSFLGRLRDARAAAGGGAEPSPQAVAARSATGGRDAEPPPADSLPPGLADHPDYTILRELGRGGMGVVYLAHNTIMGRDEVLKVMGAHIMERPGIFDRFQREIRAVARLHHKNIVTAYSAFRLGGGLVFAMEYVEGMDLARLIKVKGPLPVVHAAYFAQQAARGLQHAHERGMVHRDIKPHNLMLTHDGDLRVVKILDFGLAKATREGHVDAALTQSGQALGTPDYIAPEQILNAPDVDVRADVYSLGCTLYFFLTGRAPFRGNSLYDLYQAHMSREADPLNRIRPDVPSGLAALASKMIAKDPADRFQTPAEVADALAPFLKKAAADPRPATAPPRPAATDPAVELTRDDRPIPTPPPIPKPTAASPDKPAPPEAMWTSLIDFRDTEAAGRSATPPPVVLPARTAARGKLPPRAVAIGLGALGTLLALALLAAQLFVRTPDGTIVFDDLPKDAVVTVDGAKVDVAWAEGDAGRVSVAAGPHGLEVRQGRVKLYGDRVTVDAGKPFSIRLERPASTPTATEELPEADAADGFTPLFNGKDLSGWKPAPNQPGDWRVEGGVLVGTTPKRGYLDTIRGDYKDFNLRVEARINDGGDAGVFVRSDPQNLTAYEAQINSTNRDPSRTGSLFRPPAGIAVAAVREPLAGPDEWFTMDVTVEGAHVVVKVNGRTTADYVDPQPLTSGHIALQVHNPQTRVEFRRIEIKELDAAPPVVAPAPAAAPAGGFTPLFNGRDTTGWKMHPDQPGDWRVENGVLVGTAPGASHLYTTRGDYKDFELRVKARINGGGNSGVLFRASDNPRPKWPQGYEAQVYAGEGPQTGSLYRGAGAPEVVLSRPATAPTGLTKPDDWFTMNVVVRGSRVVVKVNGQSAADYVDPRPFASQGHIALQVHGAQTRVEFWTIEIKELDPVAGPSEPAADARPQPAADGFTPLFNRWDLGGWKAHPSQAGDWRVEGGVLVGTTSGRGFLYTERGNYKDFNLRVEARINDGGNSGVFVRASGDLKATWPEAYEAQIDSTHRDPNRTGSLYRSPSGVAVVPFREVLAKPDEWFTMNVIAEGAHVVVKVNGRTTADYVDPQPLTSGHIALQLHNPQTRVEFRRIEIKELDAEPSPAPAPREASSRIFNGIDLTGWTVDSGPKDGWTVEGGALAAKGPGDYRKAGFILSDRDYGDFRLRFEYQASPGANSGVTFRARPGEFQGAVAHPLQIELFDRDHPDLKNGTFFWSTSFRAADTAPPARPAEMKPTGEWNAVELTVRGDVMTFAVNGREVQGARLDALAGRPGANPALGRRRGRIGFQSHTGTVRFRNIEILGEPAASAWPADAREFRGARYKLFPEKRSWHQAQEECRKRGGRLAVVRDAAQDAFLHGLVREAKVEAAWLGATDERAEGRWAWVDGSPMTYANWAAEQPNNKGAGEHYLVLVDYNKQGVPFDGRWSDQPDVSVQHTPAFICEWLASAAK